MNSRTTSPESLKYSFLSLQKEKFPNSHQRLLVDLLNVCRRLMSRWGSLGHMRPSITLRPRSIQLPNASPRKIKSANFHRVRPEVAKG